MAIVFEWQITFNFCFRFVVRDFVYDEEELAASKNEISRLTSDKKKLFVSIFFITDFLLSTFLLAIY